MTESSDESAVSGVDDEQLPDDLVPGDDNPLAEGLPAGESVGDLLEEGKPADESDGSNESGDAVDESGGTGESGGTDESDASHDD